MRLPDFKVEQWMNDYENDAIYNMTDTCVKALTLQELLDLEDFDFNELTLDYGQITGDVELKKEILSLYERGTIDNITTAQGCLQANELVMNTLLEKGDEVICVVPGYQQFVDIPKSIGCKVNLIELDERDWQVGVEKFRKILNSSTKMIILNNPSNPTGTEYSKDFMNLLIEACQSYGTYILCDEVYRGLNQEVSISDIYENGISTSSLSKVFSLAGLRLGWIKANEYVIHQINVRRDYSMISTGPLVDKLGRIALKHKDELVLRAKSIISSNKNIVREWLKENPRFDCVLPNGGTVCFLKYYFDLKSETFAKLLLAEKGVFFVPGSCFDKEYYFRLGLAQDSKQFKAGLDELSNFVDEHLIS
ncbi:aminotransferase class I/II-fold pyridoxal phosphate-dependent enzyme [uncultured Holdemanella sp.]|uniref:aminotransferase class I/II-fold pyridoxal phosphate-dependent enzyme n=1 Tax=uncultured Holdemanella sp. TaxID=1763549 RepID=UPI0025FBF2D2|nr:aminotransferase class I/II-fold pyridoxal phosphate-dependent enzyme [uncultured Holdemanella sp.]